MLPFVRFAALVAFALMFCRTAAAETSGWLLVFDTSGGNLDASAIVATERFVPGRTIESGAWRFVMRDASGRTLYSVPVNLESRSAHDDSVTTPVTVRAPTLPNAARFEIVDLAGAVMWSRTIDPSLNRSALGAAKAARKSLQQATTPGHRPGDPAAITRLAIATETRRRELLRETSVRFQHEPTEARWREMQQALGESSVQPPLRMRQHESARPVPSLPMTPPVTQTFNVPQAEAPLAPADQAVAADMIDVYVHPKEDPALVNMAWNAGCADWYAPEQTNVAAYGNDAARVRVPARTRQSCWFEPKPPYLWTWRKDVQFQAGQTWFPPLVRGNLLTFVIGGDSDADFDGEATIYQDGLNIALANKYNHWQTTVPTGMIVASFGRDGFMPLAIGPRRIERDERIEVSLRRSALLTGKVRMGTSTALDNATTYGRVTATRSSDGAFVHSAGIVNNSGSASYAMTLPLGTYDLKAELFEEPASHVLHLAAATLPSVNVTAQTQLDVTIPEPARKLTLIRSLPGCGPIPSSEAWLRQNGRLISKPVIGVRSVTCSSSRQAVTSVLGISEGEYEISLKTTGAEPTPWQTVDLRTSDVTLAFDITPSRFWRPQVLDAQQRPQPTVFGTLYDEVGRWRENLFPDADGRLSISVNAGWTLDVTPPMLGRSLGKLIAFESDTPPVGDLVLDDLPPSGSDVAPGVRRIVQASRAKPLRVLVIGDGYTNARETWTDVNGNGVWDGYVLTDLNGNGVYELYADHLGIYGHPTTPPTDGFDYKAASEPFVDSNADGALSIDDEALFYANVETYARDFLGADYWSQHRGDFEIDAAFLASEQAGGSVRSPPGGQVTILRRTLFDSAYDTWSGILSIDWTKAHVAAEQLLPGYDLLVVMTNDVTIGGRANASAHQIPGNILTNGGYRLAAFRGTPIAHEAGHALGSLGDEYEEFFSPSPWAYVAYPNLSGQGERNTVIWKDQLDPASSLPAFAQEGVGIYPGASRYVAGIYRPSWTSIMRGSFPLFNTVSRHAMDERLSKLLDEQPEPGSLSGNWYDRRRSGHGIDLQLYSRDADGDLYFVTFYTYDAAGKPEWYQALGRLSSGLFMPIAGPGGKTLTRVSGAQGTPDPLLSGDLSIDFTRTEACQTPDRAGAPKLAAMYWSIGGRSSTWCIEPATTPEQNAAPKLTGHWYAPSDPGWGMEVLSIADGAGAPTLVAILYYRDATGEPRWASGSTADYAPGQTLTLYQTANGYCRQCAAPATQTLAPIGSMTLTLTAPLREAPASAANRVDIDIASPGTGTFRKTNVPVTLLSEPLQ